MMFSDSSYLNLMAQAARLGLHGLPDADKSRHTAALMRFAAGDGFRARRGQTDLYYTAFAVRALHALDRLDDDTAGKVSSYCGRQLPNTLIDLSNLLELRMLLGEHAPAEELPLELAEKFRTADGGYGKTPDAACGSTYQTFLTVLSYNLLAQKQPDAESLRRFALSRQCADGGFCEETTAGRGSTNATAAGVGLLTVLECGEQARRNAVSKFLKGMQSEDGGWRAVRAAPLSDLLSTYTAVVTLASLDALSPECLARAREFSAACERAGGGFGAGPWDPGCDTEYTFYGLGLEAIGRLQG